jgi:hypothetical protein
VLQPGDVQAQAFQRQQREEQPALPVTQPLDQPGTPRDVVGGERDHADGDVGVLGELVRRVVVLVVLAAPPVDAHAGHTAGQDPRGPLVPRRRVEDLPVGAVVAEEGDLDQDDGQCSGHQQLEPRVADQHEAGDDPGQREQHQTDAGPVVAVPAAQQAHVSHRVGEIGVETGESLLRT